MTIHELLFGDPEILFGASPLFASQADLARAILLLPKSEYAHRSVASIKASINQSLRTDKSGRPFSAKLQKAVGQAIKARLVGSDDLDQVLSQFNEAVVQLRRAQKTKSTSDDDAFAKLKSLSRTAAHQLLFTPAPREILSERWADILLGIMTERLAIGQPQPEKSPEVHYSFFVKNPNVAIQYWKVFRAYLLDKLDLPPEEANQEIARINSEKSNQSLQLYSVNPLLTCIILNIFEPESEKRQGFTVHYHPDSISVGMMSEEDLWEWYNECYLKVITEPARWDLKRIDAEQAFKTLGAMRF